MQSDGGEGQTSLTRKLDNLRRKRDELASYIDRVNGGSKGQKRFILNDPEAFTNAFSALYPYEELHETMRKVAFTWALRKHRYSSHKLRSLTPTPSIDSVSKIHDFVDHIVNDKTYGELFVGNKKKKVTSEFRKLCSTRALEEAMLRHQENATRKSKEELQFIPTRGLLLEFSGDISDTCWTDKYDSIGSRMPNMTSIIMKRNPGQPTERLVGAAFLIETVDADTNEPVLVLRGVNPIESYINKVSVEEFYKAVTDYTKTIAAKRGMKPAIVIDDHSGGSSSNRPVLYSYHESLIQEDRDMPPLKKVVVRDDDTYFNGYDITTDTYAIA